MASLTDKKFNAVNNFLMKYVDPEAAKSFKDARNKGKEIEWLEANWETLDEYEPWTQTYSSIKDLTMPPEGQMQKIYNSNPDFTKISKARMKTILANNDFTLEQLKDYYDFRNYQKSQMEEFNKKRYPEISKEYTEANRAKDDSRYNSFLANEYAREHYIKGHPVQAAINEVAGKVAAASDFAPFPFSLAGPAIRTTQKLAADKPVLTLSTGLDVAGSIIPDIAERPAKMLWQYLKGSKFGKFLESKWAKQLENRIKAEDNMIAEQAMKDLDKVKGLDLDRLTNTEIIDLYNNIKTPEIRSALEEYWKARGAVEEGRSLEELASTIATKADDMTGAARNKALTEADLIKAASDKAAKDEALITAERKAEHLAKMKTPELQVKTGNLPTEQPLMRGGDFNPYYKDVPLSDISEYMTSQIEPSKLNDALYNIIKLGGRKMARTTIGGRTGQWDAFDPEPKDNRESNINEVIKMFSNRWSLSSKPEGYDTDPLIREAYDKWKNSLPMYQFNDWRP